jgi:hypothetical protein
MTESHTLPVFVAADDQPAQSLREFEERPDREFERLVNADLRDKFAACPAYKVLSRKDNLVRWLQTLNDIRESISAQNGHDNAALASHPDKPVGGGDTPQSYADAKREVVERKRRRSRAMQAVTARLGEVRRLIGTEPLQERAVGEVIDGLLMVRRCVLEGRDDAAMEKITSLILMLAGTAEAEELA